MLFIQKQIVMLYITTLNSTICIHILKVSQLQNLMQGESKIAGHFFVQNMSAILIATVLDQGQVFKDRPHHLLLAGVFIYTIFHFVSEVKGCPVSFNSPSTLFLCNSSIYYKTKLICCSLLFILSQFLVSKCFCNTNIHH